jgi:hypothetical protein
MRTLGLILILAACGATPPRSTQPVVPAELVGTYVADPIPPTTYADPRFDDRLLAICADGRLGVVAGQSGDSVGTWDRWGIEDDRFVVTLVEPPRDCILSTTPGVADECAGKPATWRAVPVAVRATADGLETRKPRVGWTGDGLIDVTWRRRPDLALCD